MSAPLIDPVCLIHGKRRSEHDCLYCALCFKSLTPEECSYLPNGKQQDVCVPCAEAEQETMASLTSGANEHRRELARLRAVNDEMVERMAQWLWHRFGPKGVIEPGRYGGSRVGAAVRNDARRALRAALNVSEEEG